MVLAAVPGWHKDLLISVHEISPDPLPKNSRVGACSQTDVPGRSPSSAAHARFGTP